MKRLIRKIKSRLKKKAFNTITLYHHTSAQHFIQMMEEGEITSGGYNNNISGGGHQGYFVLSNNGSGLFFDNYNELVEYSNRTGILFDKSLIDEINRLKSEDPENWDKQSLNVSMIRPSHNEIGVYLTSNVNDSEHEYGVSAVKNSPNKDLPNFPVTIEVRVYEDALGPDLDDGEVSSIIGVPYWKQTLDSIHQCVHNGPISIDSITRVKACFDRTYKVQSGSKYYKYTLQETPFIKWLEDRISTNWQNPETLYSQIINMFEEYDNTDFNELLEKDDDDILLEDELYEDDFGDDDLEFYDDEEDDDDNWKY